MLIRISLILAILAAIGAGVVNVVIVKDKITALTSDRDTQKSDKVKAQTELASTKKTLASTKNELTQTQQNLADSQTAQKKAEDVAAAQIKHATDLANQLANVTKEREDAKNNLAAYQATGIPADQISKLSRDLKNAMEAIAASDAEKIVLGRRINTLSNELEKYTGHDNIVRLPAGLKGKIVVVDPKWDFVVLDIGDTQGVLQDGELLVSRAGKLVAKVIVRTVEKDRCIANIVPGWKLGEVIEGDMVSPAHPAS